MNKKALALSALSTAMFLGATSNATAGDVPYHFAGQYEFDSCIEGKVTSYVKVAVNEGSFEVATDTGSAILYFDGTTDVVRIPVPVTCGADGSISTTPAQMADFVASLSDSCDELFPATDVDYDLNAIICPILEDGLVGIVEKAQEETPEFLVTSQEVIIEDLVGSNAAFASWWLGGWEGVADITSTRHDGHTYNTRKLIQDHGYVVAPYEKISIDALLGLEFADGGLICGYGHKEYMRPNYNSGSVHVKSEYNHGFACGADIDGQTIQFEITPVTRVEYNLNKVD